MNPDDFKKSMDKWKEEFLADLKEFMDNCVPRKKKPRRSRPGAATRLRQIKKLKG